METVTNIDIRLPGTRINRDITQLNAVILLGGGNMGAIRALQLLLEYLLDQLTNDRFGFALLELYKLLDRIDLMGEELYAVFMGMCEGDCSRFIALAILTDLDGYQLFNDIDNFLDAGPYPQGESVDILVTEIEQPATFLA